MKANWTMLLGLWMGMTACSESELDPGAYHWQMHLVGIEDGCHEDEQSFRDTSMTYSLSYATSDATLALNRNTFARGTISGCSLSYESPVFREEGPGDDEEDYVQWILSGSADHQQGGAGCGIEAEAYEFLADYFPADAVWGDLGIEWEPDELDWVGLETFTIVGVGDTVAERPDEAYEACVEEDEGAADDCERLRVGCEYTVMTTGKYIPPED